MRSKLPLSFAGLIGIAMLLLACAQSEGLRTNEQTTVQPTAAPASEKHPPVEFNTNCYECHLNASPEIVAKWETGKHGLVNVGCAVCHGDGEDEFFAKPQGERCIGCHSAKKVDFSAMHVKNCSGWHGGHDLKFHKSD